MRRAVLGVLALSVVACSPGIAGEPKAPKAFDPCSLIDVEQLKSDGVVANDRPTPLVRDIDPVEGRSDWCHVGGRGLSPLSVGLVIGEPFAGVDDLLPRYLQDRRRTSVGSDEALIGSSSVGSTKTLAVEHGAVQLLVTNFTVGGDILGKELSDAELVDQTQSIIARLPSPIPDAPRDMPAACDRIDGVSEILGPVTFARGRADDDTTSCDFVGAKHLALTVRIADRGVRINSTVYPVVDPPLSPGTESRARRDNSGMAVETAIDDGPGVSTILKVLCYGPGCDKYGTVEPSTTLTDDDRALLQSVIDVARSLR